MSGQITSQLSVMVTGTDHQGLTAVLFLAVVGLTIGITVWASRQNKGAADYYAGGRSFSGFQNGLAIGGDYMSAASFLGISGAIALSGYDGFLYSIGFLVAWLVALLLTLTGVGALLSLVVAAMLNAIVWFDIPLARRGYGLRARLRVLRRNWAAALGFGLAFQLALPLLPFSLLLLTPAATVAVSSLYFRFEKGSPAQ